MFYSRHTSNEELFPAEELFSAEELVLAGSADTLLKRYETNARRT
jgi:hypothetical protein